MVQSDGEKESSGKLRVFISYSRVDGVFMELVRQALVSRGYAVSIDKTDIVEGEDWRARLDRMILAIEAVVFIISPDSVARWDVPPPDEAVCAWEIRRTIELGKRLVVVDFRRASAMTLPPQLRVSNHIDAVALGADFSQVADSHRRLRAARDAGSSKAMLNAAAESYALVGGAWRERWHGDAALRTVIDGIDRALNVDTVLWERELAHWLQRAEAWRTTEAEKQPHVLLPIGELALVTAWTGRRTLRAPTLPPIIEQFVDASAKKLDAENRRQRRIIGNAFVKPAEEANARGEYEHALRLGAAGAVLAGDVNFELVPELWPPLFDAIKNNRCIRVLKQNNSTAVAFSLDGKFALTGPDAATVQLHTANGQTPIASLKGHTDAVNSVSFSPDGQRVVTGSDDRTARIWDAASGAEIAVLQGHIDSVWSASFSPDAQRVVTGSDDRTVRIWDAASGAEIAVLRGHIDGVGSASFSPDGQRAVSSSVSESKLWNAISGVEIATLIGGIASFSPDGRRLLTVHNYGVRIWCALRGTHVAVLEGHSEFIMSASFSPDGKRVVTAYLDLISIIWDVESGAQIATLVGHNMSVSGASFSPDGQRVITHSHDSTARIWDAKSGVEIANLKAHTGSIGFSAFSSDGKYVITCADNTARLWRAETGYKITTLDTDSRSVTGASLRPDGARVATNCNDDTVRVWAVDNGSEIAVLKGHTDTIMSVSFSPDGRRVATGSCDMKGRIWDSESGTEIAVLHGHIGSVWSASFSPDGQRVVTGSNDGTARIWDAATGAEIAVLKGHTDSVLDASFSTDGKYVVTGSSDKTARIWSAASAAEIALLNGRTESVWDASFSTNWTYIINNSSGKTSINKDVMPPWDIRNYQMGMSSKYEAAFIYDMSRDAAFERDRALLLSAALAGGIGQRTEIEESDLLMKEAPEDLFSAVLGKTGRTAYDPEIRTIAAMIRAPLHLNCYMSPTHFDETFGQDVPAISSSTPAAEIRAFAELPTGAATIPSTHPPTSIAPVTPDDLIGQQFVEMHRGVAIFRLVDGRHHVVCNGSVRTISQARSVADALAAAAGAA